MGLLDNTEQNYYSDTSNHGNYQFVSLNDIINQFIIAYVGEDKLIPKLKRSDVAFHAQRALAELSFDTFKSCKSQEIQIPASLQVTLPQDYVNYTKLSFTDSAGIKRVLYPTSKTSNPLRPQFDDDGDFLFHGGKLLPSGNLIRNGNFEGGSEHWLLNANNSSEIQSGVNQAAGTTANPLADSVGWFWDKNKIVGYNLPANYGVQQINVPIINGEQYEITYTVSGYTTGSFNWMIVDNIGDTVTTTAVTANGTYTNTFTAGSGAERDNYTHNMISFRSRLSDPDDGNATLDSVSLVRVDNDDSSETWAKYKLTTPSELNNDDYEDDTYWPLDGARYGLDPQHAQVNGSFYIDCKSGKIHFSSNMNEKTIVLDYISDSLGTDDEMRVHKFAEEAIYKWIAYAVLSTRANVPEGIIQRFKKEKFAETRKAKLRLSNIKLEEITRILRGKSKFIKH